MGKKEKVLTLTNAKKETGVHYTLNHTGKMAGMQSLSTSCLQNPFCKAYAKDPNKVCSICYSKRQMSYQTSMQGCFAENTRILTTHRLALEEIPYINASMFRFESFGDIQNELQVVNYFNICRKNPNVDFALWTKNPAIIGRTISNLHEEKPENLEIVLSSHFLNRPADISKMPYIDKVFTVFTKEYVKEHGIEINCGAKLCIACGICYRKNGIKQVNELAK